MSPYKHRFLVSAIMSMPRLYHRPYAQLRAWASKPPELCGLKQQCTITSTVLGRQAQLGTPRTPHLASGGTDAEVVGRRPPGSSGPKLGYRERWTLSASQSLWACPFKSRKCMELLKSHVLLFKNQL